VIGELQPKRSLFRRPGHHTIVRLSKRLLTSVFVISALVSLGGCSRTSESPQQRQADANSAAGKVGKAAHRVAVETQKAADAAGRKLAKAAHQAHEGWKEAAQEDKAKGK
jgi:hypothetical protein